MTYYLLYYILVKRFLIFFKESRRTLVRVDFEKIQNRGVLETYQNHREFIYSCVWFCTGERFLIFFKESRRTLVRVDFEKIQNRGVLETYQNQGRFVYSWLWFCTLIQCFLTEKFFCVFF